MMLDLNIYIQSIIQLKPKSIVSVFQNLTFYPDSKNFYTFFVVNVRLSTKWQNQ